MGDGRGRISPSREVFSSPDLRYRKFSLVLPSSLSSPYHHPPPLLSLFRRIVRRLLETVPCRSWSLEWEVYVGG
ncbi:hypothetical protein RHMOL_Rhmol06G0067300 [Rhododendron molle]|uniref:Uncharacterized protein n=1 Tax=Rhododendron molle TaxID=49168 RepID=A0ACC0NBH2_RHOML|nr:hypothetical protein RHMOL_Rhmol06G0067300 [Rhododendron molle]